MPIYQQELGRGLQDPAALAYYGEELKSGRMTPEQVRANISGSIEGQQYDAKQAAAAQNSANLGFGATTGNASDDAFQIDKMNKLLAANSVARFADGTQYDANDQGDFMNVFTGASDYLQTFATEMSKVLDNSLVGKIANTAEGARASAALVEETGAPEEDINLALEIFNTGSEVVKAAFKLTPFGALVAAYVPSLGADGRLVSSSTTDSSYTTGNNDNNVNVTPYGSNLDNDFYSLTQRVEQEDDYTNRFISPY
jgi:hypothetical protein